MPQSLDFVKTRLSSFYSRARIGKKWNGQVKSIQFSWSLIDKEYNPVDLIYRWHLCLSQEFVFHSVSSDLSIINPPDSAWFSRARWVFFQYTVIVTSSEQIVIDITKRHPTKTRKPCVTFSPNVPNAAKSSNTPGRRKTKEEKNTDALSLDVPYAKMT